MRPSIVTLALFFGLAAAPFVACSTSGGGSGGDAGADTGPAPCPIGYEECDGNQGSVCETRIDSDVAHCGGCGKACAVPATTLHQVATCKSSTCNVACAPGFVDCDKNPANGCELEAALCGVTVLATVNTPGGLAIDDAFVYYAAKGSTDTSIDGAIYKVPKAGGTSTLLVNGLNHPISVEVDDTTVFIAVGGSGDQADASLVTVPKTGGTPLVLAKDLVRVANPVPSGDVVYFTTREQPAGNVRRIKKDGSESSPTTLVTGVVNPGELLIAGGGLVFTGLGTQPNGSDSTVERVNLDGSGRLLLTNSIPSPSYRIAATTDALLVGSQSDGTIKRVAFTGGTPTTIATDVGQVQETLLDGATLWVTTGAGGKLAGVATTGGAVTSVLENQVFPSYLAMDAEYLYFTDGRLSQAASIKKVRKPIR